MVCRMRIVMCGRTEFDPRGIGVHNPVVIQGKAASLPHV
jgi:hypothetical protein